MIAFFCTFWLTFLSFWTLLLYQQPNHDNLLHFSYNLGYALFSLIAFIFSAYQFIKSEDRKSLYLILSLSSLCFLLANSVWFYYNLFLENSIPYPSPADFLWLAFYLFSFTASIQVFASQQPKVDNLFEIILITIVLFFPLHSFMKINQDPSSSSIALLLNFLYPLLDSVLVAIFLTSFRLNQNQKQVNLLFLFSFLSFTIADSLFAFQTNNQTYWNGNLTDLFFAVAIYLFTLGILKLNQFQIATS